jgi:predicted SpoU family rRNA methylase
MEEKGLATAHTLVHRRGIGDVWEMLQGRGLPVAAGAEVAPKKIHGLTGYNVAAKSRPHSVISAPAEGTNGRGRPEIAGTLERIGNA